MSSWDEPVMGQDSDSDENTSESGEALSQRIRALMSSEPFGVLCTQGQNQPYGSVIAFVASENLQEVFFTTPKATRKYRLLEECDRVALVVDSRSRRPEDMRQVEAVTATGRADQVSPGPERDRLSALLIAKHPYLESFVKAESVAMFQIHILRYFHVTRFQEVNQWIPTGDG